jgi:hypothetical protein
MPRVNQCSFGHTTFGLFATEAVTGGLPVHIAAKVLGHASLQTTQHYLAVFPDEMIRSYRTYLDNRRSIRPEAEYREPTQEEWAEFRQHFHERKLELGTCGRPYGTPCQHFPGRSRRVA